MGRPEYDGLGLKSLAAQKHYEGAMQRCARLQENLAEKSPSKQEKIGRQISKISVEGLRDARRLDEVEKEKKKEGSRKTKTYKPRKIARRATKPRKLSWKKK